MAFNLKWSVIFTLTMVGQLSQAFIDNQTLVGMKVMSKDPGKVWCI